MGRRLRVAMELVAALANLAPAHRELLVDDARDSCEDEEDGPG